MIDRLKAFIATRGAQVATGWIQSALLALALHLHLSGDPATVHTSAAFLGSLAAAGLLEFLDHYSSARQATNIEDHGFSAGFQRGMIEAAQPSPGAKP